MKNRFKITLLGLLLSYFIISWCLPPITLSKKPAETNDTDSLSSVLLSSELLGIMDTTLSILEGRIIDLTTNTPIKKQLISIKSGFKLHMIKTDSTGHFKFNMISVGDYSIRVSNKRYKAFVIDSLHLDSGEIRALTIGLIKL